MDRKLHVDTLIFIVKINVFSYSRQIGNCCVLCRNTSNSYVIPQKASLRNFLIKTLLLYIPLLTLTDRITDEETHTLASRGLEELFFQLCCCVSFWFWREIGFGFTYLRTLLNNFFGTNIFLIVVEVLRYFVRQFRYFRMKFLVESKFSFPT